MDREKIESGFQFLKSEDGILAVLLFGSEVKDHTNVRSDVEVCIVAAGKEPWDVLKEVYSEINAEKKNHDVHIF